MFETNNFLRYFWDDLDAPVGVKSAKPFFVNLLLFWPTIYCQWTVDGTIALNYIYIYVYIFLHFDTEWKVGEVSKWHAVVKPKTWQAGRTTRTPRYFAC